MYFNTTESYINCIMRLITQNNGKEAEYTIL